MRRFLLGLVCAFHLGAAAAVAQMPERVLPPPAPDQLHMAIMRYFAAGHLKDTSDFGTATTDLDGDGIDDAVVLVRGLSWCVAGAGCTLLVFRGTPSGFRFVSRSIRAAAPVRVSKMKSKGWRSLIVHTPPVANRLLPYDGRGYPITSGGQRPATAAQVDAATVLIEGPPTTP